MASRTVRARLDGPSERALRDLMREGLNESEAVRTALREAGQRRARRSVLVEEAARLAADPRDRDAVRQAAADLDGISPDWTT